MKLKVKHKLIIEQITEYDKNLATGKDKYFRLYFHFPGNKHIN